MAINSVQNISALALVLSQIGRWPNKNLPLQLSI
jgi:hypothetical protein